MAKVGSRQEYIVISYYGQLENELHIFPYDDSMGQIEEVYDAINEDYGYDFSHDNCSYFFMNELNIQIH